MSSEITINSNIAAIQTQRRLGQNTASLNRIFERLSSGQRINHASDDAAGLAISDSLRADRRVLNQGVRNLNDGVSLLNIGEGALSELTNIVTRIRELAEQAATGTLGYRQRQSLDKEAQQLSKEYTRIAQTVEFNGIKMFDGSVTSLRIQAGYGSPGGVFASIGGAKGTGSFDPAVSKAFLNNIASVVLGDLNGDGILDMVTGQYEAGVSISLGRGDGTFGPSLSYNPGLVGTSNVVSLGDLNGDGILDIVNAGYIGATGFANIRLGVGNGTFGAPASYATESGPTFGIALGDLNADGILDLVTAGNSGGGTATVRLGRGNGTFGTAITYAAETSISLAVSLGDLNGDGVLDLTTFGEAGATAWATTRLGNGDGSFAAAMSYNSQLSSARTAALGDLNGDGILDLVVGGIGTEGRTAVRMGIGNGTFGGTTSYIVQASDCYNLKLADIDGDGNLDILSVGDNGGPGDTMLQLGNGNGTFRPAAPIDTGVGGNLQVAAGDLNGDGVLDITAAGYSTSYSQLGVSTSGVGALLPFSLQYRYTALQAMADLDRALKRISAHRGFIGAFQSRIGSAINNVQITIENYSSAESQIRDTDVAQEAANLAKGRILQQAAASVLANANLEPRIALDLLRGAS